MLALPPPSQPQQEPIIEREQLATSPLSTQEWPKEGTSWSPTLTTRGKKVMVTVTKIQTVDFPTRGPPGARTLLPPPGMVPIIFKREERKYEEEDILDPLEVDTGVQGQGEPYVEFPLTSEETPEDASGRGGYPD